MRQAGCGLHCSVVFSQQDRPKVIDLFEMKLTVEFCRGKFEAEVNDGGTRTLPGEVPQANVHQRRTKLLEGDVS